MNLYRLDPAEPTDPLWRRLHPTERGPGAIQVARRRAARLGCNVAVSKIDGRTLRVSVVRVVDPEGTVTRP